MISVYNYLEKKNLIFLFVAVVAFTVFFHRLADSPLSGDGCHYAEMAKEMTASGNFLTPLWDYKPYFFDGKPPMLYWLLGASGRIFGFNSAAMRVPMAVFGFTGIIFLFLFVKKYFSQLAAFLSSISLIFTHQYLFHAREPVTDIVFSVFFALAVMSFRVGRTENKPFFYYGMGIFVGLALLTRQLPGFFIYAVIAAYVILARDFAVFRQPHFYGGILLSAMVSLPWYVAMYAAHGNWFITEFFGCIYRFGIDGSTVSPADVKWSNYLNIILANYQPWLLFMLYGIFVHARASVSSKKVEDKILYVFLWSFVPLAIFQTFKMKSSQYIVPVYFGFSIFTALGIEAFKETVRLKIAGALVIIVSALCVVYLATPLMPQTCDSDEFKDTIKIIPAVKNIVGNIIALNGRGQGYWHFNNCLMFYADKRVVSMSGRQALDAMAPAEKKHFVMFKEFYEDFKKSAPSAPNVITETSGVVLFSNYD